MTARNIDCQQVVYLNLEGPPKPMDVKGKPRSILKDRDYQNGFTLTPFDADFVELE